MANDLTVLIPWSHGKPLAWKVTVPDIFSQFHNTSTALNAGATADKAACSKIKNTTIWVLLNCVPFALETGGSWNSEAIKLTNDIRKRITTINSQPLETQFLFQRISIAVPRGNALAFQNIFPNDNNFSDLWEPLYRAFNLISIFKYTGFVLVSETKK